MKLILTDTNSNKTTQKVEQMMKFNETLKDVVPKVTAVLLEKTWRTQIFSMRICQYVFG